MMLFEICPQCSQIHRLTPEQMSPMVLSADDREMQCGVCGHSYPLREVLIRTAKERRAKWVESASVTRPR